MAMKPGWCSAAPVCLGPSLAYAVITDALAIPLTLMLIGLIFRGVAFEFRFKATPHHKPFWDKAFLAGSLLATFTQGWSLAR
jgi:cytochrome d ubiquinol oxidase subunit II